MARATATATEALAIPEPRLLPLRDLKPHPRNYKTHPADQLAHIKASLREHGFYRNIVAARDLTILAGHGVVQAALEEGYEQGPVVVLDLDPVAPQALKLLAGDNEISHLGEVDDRALSELLKEIKDTDLHGLLGTGYDTMMLANLAMVTRPASEIADFDEAAEWVGMPDDDAGVKQLKLIISFRNAEDRAAFGTLIGANLTAKTMSVWWPAREREDLSAVRYEG